MPGNCLLGLIGKRTYRQGSDLSLSREKDTQHKMMMYAWLMIIFLLSMNKSLTQRLCCVLLYTVLLRPLSRLFAERYNNRQVTCNSVCNIYQSISMPQRVMTLLQFCSEWYFDIQQGALCSYKRRPSPFRQEVVFDQKFSKNQKKIKKSNDSFRKFLWWTTSRFKGMSA